MEELRVKLDVFEGPLDLLLHLIKTLEIDIYDIPIAEITEQYISYIQTMQTLQLEVAGEYIVMAATLMAIKSKMLLPKQEMVAEEDDSGLLEEGEDPRAALVAQLLEYRKFKYAATVLKEREEERSQHYSKEATNLEEYQKEIPPLDPNQVTTIDLFFAFHQMLERRKNQRPRETTIAQDSETVEDRIHYIRKKINHLPTKTGLAFTDLFERFTKSEMVTTFMALLELVKSGEIIAKQTANYQPIILYGAEERITETNGNVSST